MKNRPFEYHSFNTKVKVSFCLKDLPRGEWDSVVEQGMAISRGYAL